MLWVANGGPNRVIQDYRLLESILAGTWMLFAFAFGACVGSLINVLVYRLPLGLDVVKPASRCPSCETVLTWRENIPVFGWLMLKGRCRFCKSSISPEYPLVEAFVGLLFAGLYALWFVVPVHARGMWLGLDWGEIPPEWVLNGFGAVWPTFIITVILLSSLVAMTLIDARTFQIPLVLTWIPMVVGVVGHTAHAGWIQATRSGLRRVPEGDWWMIPTGGPFAWELLGLAIGGGVGVLVSAGLQKVGVLKPSFADYDEWEQAQHAQTDASVVIDEHALQAAAGVEPELVAPAQEVAAADTHSEPERTGRLKKVSFVTAACGLAGGGVLWALGWSPLGGVAIGLLLGAFVGGLLTRASASEAETQESAATMWILYPHARREALRELVWVTPAVVLGVVGTWIGAGHGSVRMDEVTQMLAMPPAMPLWLSVFGGALLGLLVGGATVWGIRIFGSLAFGKEAMGMGDVWLMAAVGACLGWMDAVLVFFVAPFIALYLTAVMWAWNGKAMRALPYGPSLAAATLLMVVGEAGFEWLLGMIWRLDSPIVLP
jgi:prepilin signal peptidase PulO-like enzyme (type II secretory pathway)